MKLTGLQDELLRQLFALSSCSNLKVYNSAVDLGVINLNDIQADAFHYHVELLKLRPDGTSHQKRRGTENPNLKLNGCRLLSSARLQWTFRIIRFKHQPAKDEVFQINKGKPDHQWGVLAVGQELCSGFLAASVIQSGAVLETKLGVISPIKLVNFIAGTISLTKLKSQQIHFSLINFSPPTNSQEVASHPDGIKNLVRGWLGYEISSSFQQDVTKAYNDLAEHICKKVNKTASQTSRRLAINPSIFIMDFPAQYENSVLDISTFGLSREEVETKMQRCIYQHNFFTHNREHTPYEALSLAHFHFNQTKRNFDTNDNLVHVEKNIPKLATSRERNIIMNRYDAILKTRLNQMPTERGSRKKKSRLPTKLPAGEE